MKNGVQFHCHGSRIFLSRPEQIIEGAESYKNEFDPGR
jgi:hypothetical protein